MKTKTKRPRNSLAYYLLLVILVILLLGVMFHLSQAFLVPSVIILGLLAGANAIWTRAKRDANGSEWWQDDDASGWRGY